MKGSQLQTGELAGQNRGFVEHSPASGYIAGLAKVPASGRFPGQAPDQIPDQIPDQKHQHFMNEQQRQAYLEAMGIQVYYPRQPLANALASPDYVWPEPAEPQAGTHPAAGSDSAGKAKAARPASARVVVDLDESRRERRRESPADSAAATQQAQEQAQEQEAANAEPALQFRLAFYRPGPDLAVLSELPMQARADSAEARELLGNILLALSVESRDSDWQAEMFNWPLSPDMPAREATEEHARQALGGFITQRRQQGGFSNLLLFSSRLAPLMPGAARDQGTGDFPARKLNCQVCCVESLQAMLALPELKREVWQQLQPLRQRLQSS
jgi:hypothetical protein